RYRLGNHRDPLGRVAILNQVERRRVAHGRKKRVAGPARGDYRVDGGGVPLPGGGPVADQPLRAALQHILNLAGVLLAETAPYGELCACFVRPRDGPAFTALVERHGPMVLALCRRVLRHAHDADDAYQATFLVLARKAASVRNRGALASWLHGAAYR